MTSPSLTDTISSMKRSLCVLGLVLVVSCSAPQSVTSPSPSATVATQAPIVMATPSPATPPPATPSGTVHPCIAGSDNPACPYELFVDRLAVALEASDYAALRPLITPTGFLGVQSGTGFTGNAPLATPDQVIDRLQRGTPDGKLRVTVARSPLLRRTQFLPPGDWYVVSTFSQFDGQAEQRVFLILRSETGTVYWSGALYNAPP